MAAFAIELDIQGVAELARLWEQSEELVREELLRTTTEVDLLLEREVKERTPVGVGASLRASIFSEERALADNVIGEVGTPMNYAIPVELGSKPHFPPIEPLKDWVRQKLNVPAEEVGQVAFLIARKISKQGTKGAHMFRDAFVANRAQVERMYDEAQTRIVNRLSDS